MRYSEIVFWAKNGMGKNKNKFHARKVDVDGETFDSQKEYMRWCELKLLEKGRKITELRRQVRFELLPTQKDDTGKVVERALSYVADFVYRDDGKLVVEDVKGYKSGASYNIFTIKRKLMLYRYGIKVTEI